MDQIKAQDQITSISLPNADNIIYSTLYNAMRSNNTEALSEIFLSSETDTHTNMLSILSQTYKEVRLKNIPLMPDTQYIVETKLIDLQFLSSKTKLPTDDCKDVQDHLNFLCELINTFLAKYHDEELEINMEFIFHARYIAQHIAVLKRMMDYTYQILPWEEMQFCLVIYLQTLTNLEKFDIICKLIVNRKRIVTYLFYFLSKLNEIRLQFREEYLECKKNPGRTLLKESVLKISPIFKDLYEDFSLLRDMYSLERIKFYLDKASAISIEENTTISELVIERTLQVIGEYIKNTPDSPNLSDDLYKSLLKSAPRNLRNILSSLRNMLSHRNRQLEEGSFRDLDLYKKIQTDLQKIQIDTGYILYKQKIDVLKVVLHRLLDLEDMEDIKSIFLQNDLQYIQEVSENAIDLEEFLKAKHLITLFCEKVLEDSSEESEAVAEVLNYLTAYETKIKHVSITYFEAINKVFNLVKTQTNLDVVKSKLRTYLSMLSASEPQILFNDIFKSLRHIHENYKIRNSGSENFLDPDKKTLEIGNILIEIYNFLKWRLRQIKWIEEMEERLVLKEEKSETESRAQYIFQIVQAKLESEKDTRLVKKAIEKVKQQHFKKYDLMNLFNEDNNEVFEVKVKSLALSAKRQKEILYCHKNKKRDKLLLMIKQIDDDYGAFLKKIANLSQLSKYVNPTKAFFKKVLKLELDKAVENAINDEIMQCYRQRLQALKICLTNIADIKSIRYNNKLMVCLEILVMELLEILNNAEMLTDNKYFLVEDSPILNGKQLRNYLAHGDILLELLPCDPVIAIIFHAEKLTNLAESILSRKNTVLGCKTNNSSLHFRNHFEESLKVINNQVQLFNCATNGSIGNVEEIIASGADIAGIDYCNGWSVLHFAIFGRNQAVFEYLIKLLYPIKPLQTYNLLKLSISLGNMENIKFVIDQMQIDINYKPKNGSSLLNLALEYRHEHIADFFLKNEAKLDMKDELTGRTALHFASENGCLKTVKFILASSRQLIDLVTVDNLTSLHLAAKTGHLNVLNSLLETFQHSKEDLNKSLELATENGHWSTIARLLLEIHNSDAKNKQISSILHLASLYGHLNIITNLINNDVNIINSNDNYGNTALHLAAQCGHCNVIRLLLASGINIDMTDRKGWTAIHWASQNDHIGVVNLLLANKSSVSIREQQQGKTAFHLAAQSGNLDILKVLLEFNADPNGSTTNGQTALHLAAQNGHCSVINILISRCQIDLNSADQNGETALIVATDNGHNDVVELLLKHEASTNYKTKKEGTSAVIRAAANGHLDILLNLIEHKADIEFQDNSGWRPLNWAVQNGYKDILDILLKHEVEVDAKSKDGGTALHTAIRNGHTDIVQKLIKHGSNINTMLIQIPPVRVAAHFGHKDIVIMLLEKGAEVDATGKDEVTPLHAASWNGHIEVVKLLIEHGAKVNAKTEEKWTPLHFAAKFGFFDICNVLLDNSANIFEENNFGANAFHTACEMGHKNIVNVLLSRYRVDVDIKSANGATGLHWASANGRINVVKTLIQNGADVNNTAKDESTPLHWVTQHSDSVLVVKELIKNGGLVNAKDVRGATPLHLASTSGHLEIVKELLENNCDVNAESKNISALHLAVALGHESIAEVLIKKGAFVNSPSCHKKTSLHIAAENGYKDIVQMLLKNKAKANLRDINDMTPLHLTVQKNFKDIARCLVEHTTDINSLDKNGHSPLHVALECQYEDVAVLLIDCNAQINMESMDGFTYLHLACRRGMLKVVLALLKHGADVNANCNFNKICPLHESLFHGQDQVAHILMKYKPNINAATTTGWTALHIAAGKGFEDTAHLLIIQGAIVNAKTRNAETPLFLASLQGHLNIVIELLKNTAEVNVKTMEVELSALGAAAQEGHYEIMKTLIKHNADLNSKNNQGLTPLHISALYGHNECVQILLENDADVYGITNTGWTALHIAASDGFVDIAKILTTGNIAVLNLTNDQGETALDLAQKQGHTEIVLTLFELINKVEEDKVPI